MSEPERKFIAPTVGEFDQLNDALTTAMVTMVECYKERRTASRKPNKLNKITQFLHRRGLRVVLFVVRCS